VFFHHRIKKYLLYKFNAKNDNSFNNKFDFIHIKNKYVSKLNEKNDIDIDLS
jgi:hypothetical protein